MGRIECNSPIEFCKGLLKVIQLDKGNTLKMVDKGI